MQRLQMLRDAMFHRMREAAFGTVAAVHLKGSVNVRRAATAQFAGELQRAADPFEAAQGAQLPARRRSPAAGR